jgi:hypothetical protein
MYGSSPHTRLAGDHPPGRSSNKHRKHWAIGASAALAASAVAALPASATITDVGVAEGHNITVFHNIDFVAVSGWTVGEQVTVEVHRGAALIGTAAGPASDPEATGSGGLEVNHGPEGVAAAGDCWTDNTPDIRPGDRVTVTNGTVTDEVLVDDIRFTGNPVEVRNGDIVVPFVARLANGNPVPRARIDSAEFRAATNNSVRFEGADVVVQRQPGGAPGEYQSRFRSPFTPTRNDDDAPFNQRQLRRALLGDGHAIGFGHVDPVPAEAMLHDGLTDAPGPAPGCEAASSARWAVDSTGPAAINARNQNRGLTVRGVSHNASSITVRLTDNVRSTTGAPEVTLTPASTTGAQAWRAHFTAGQLSDLDRNIRVLTTFVLPDGEFTDRSTVVRKDVVRPNAPRATLRSGVYRRTKRVALRAPAGTEIRYTLGNGRQARPTARRGSRFTGRRIVISSTQTLKAVSIDAVGNVSAVNKWRYRIRR